MNDRGEYFPVNSDSAHDSNHKPTWDRPHPWRDHQVEIDYRTRELESPNPRVRAHAAKRLGDLGGGASALVAALDDKNSFVRSAAAIALGFMPPESVDESIVDRLIAAIHDSDDYLASAAIRSMGRLKIQASRADILACLDDPSAMMVQAALAALGRIGNLNDAQRLVEFLNDANQETSSTAALALAMMNYAPARDQVMSGLEAILKPYAKPGSHRHRCAARYIEAAGLLHVRQVIPLLIQTAQNHVGLRSHAVQALIDMHADEAVPMLAKMMADPSPSLRNRLARMMREFDPSITLPSMRLLLVNPSVQARQSALNAVVGADDQVSIPVIRQMSKQDPSPFLRAVAVRGLATLLKQDALPDLMTFVDDPNALVRQVAFECLAHFDPLPPTAIEQIRLCANDSAFEIAQAARAILAKQPIDDIPEYSQERAESCAVPETISRDVATLLPMLEHWKLAIESNRNASAQSSDVDDALATLINALRHAKYKEE